MATNDITGDKLITGVSNEKYRQGWDLIFGKKPAPAPSPAPAPAPAPQYPETDEGNTPD